MNVSRRVLTLALVIGGFLSLARASESASSATPLPTASPLAGDARIGKATFTEYCSVCHGAGAKGFIGPNIAGINWTASGLHAIVRGGVGGYGGMPAFNADAVTDKNIADIAAYLAVPAPETPPHAPSSPDTPAAITPVASPTVASADPLHGHQIYTENCAACHGASAQGGVGPSLRGEKNRKDTAAAIAWIKHPMLPMPTLYPNPLSEKDVEDVAAYIESL